MQRPFISFLSALLLCACSDLECPEGQVRAGNTCLPCKSEAASKDGRCQATDASVDDAGSDEGDAATQSTICYLDLDGDGIGAGEPVLCPGDLSASPRAGLSTRSDDCDDKDSARSPTRSDVCDDKLDNDCDGKVDDESNNPCGGPCAVRFEHLPGEACSNGKLGACAAEGAYQCSGDSAVVCSAQGITASSEVCGDNVDNDCDGAVDEADAIDAPSWYQDCDGDGYAATRDGSRKSCSKPAPTSESCKEWTNVAPSPETKSNWDCDDARVEYAPGKEFGFPPAGAASWDLNCDGQTQMAAQPVTGAPRCVTSVIEKLNAGGPYYDCPRCMAWKDNATWTRTPTVGCPDTGYVMTAESSDPWGGAGNDRCAPREQAAYWPCK